MYSIRLSYIFYFRVTRIPSLHISSMNVSQSVECPLTSQNSGILRWNVASENGNGTGLFCATWKRFLTNRGSLEVCNCYSSYYIIYCNMRVHLGLP